MTKLEAAHRDCETKLKATDKLITEQENEISRFNEAQKQASGQVP